MQPHQQVVEAKKDLMDIMQLPGAPQLTVGQFPSVDVYLHDIGIQVFHKGPMVPPLNRGQRRALRRDIEAGCGPRMLFGLVYWESQVLPKVVIYGILEKTPMGVQQRIQIHTMSEWLSFEDVMRVRKTLSPGFDCTLSLPIDMEEKRDEYVWYLFQIPKESAPQSMPKKKKKEEPSRIVLAGR